jgi:poly(3-hydroxybutyrate) depolymerase
MGSGGKAGAGKGGSGGSMAGSGGKGSGGAGGSAAGSGGSGGSGGSAGTGKSAGCGKSRTLMNGRKTIQSGGNREYIIRVPDNYDNNHPYRLIMAYHWLNGNANQVAEGGNGGSTDDPYYGLWDLAENSTIFVAPEGLDAGWANSNNRDITLTDDILELVQNDLCIDTTRIFATGFSYGAGMSYALACARADVFRGVALYAGAQLSGCTGGTTPIAYFHVHGVADSVLNISQGRQLRDKFVMVNGCTQQSPPEAARGSGTHMCTSYAGCSDGHPVRWCTHGGDHNPTEKDSGQQKSWVPGEAWEFISQF